MATDKNSFHLMAVPKHFTSQVVEAGGRFLKLKNKELATELVKLIQQKEASDALIHILDPDQYRIYEMLGEEYEENMSLCKAVFDQNRGKGYRIFRGSSNVATCRECQKLLKRLLG